jgi:hypothetical protein
MDDVTEAWRQMVGIVGYEVSEIGRIRRSTGGASTFAGRIKTPSERKDGYMIVGFYSDGVRTNVFVHRAVAEAFIRPIAEDEEVNHIDGVKSNCVLGNLEIVTAAENMAHAARLGLTASGDRWRTPRQMEKVARLSGDGHWSRHKPECAARGDDNGSRTHPEKLERGEDRHCAKLREADIVSIRSMAARGMSLTEIAVAFSVTRQNIRYIVTRQSWKHVA